MGICGFIQCYPLINNNLERKNAVLLFIITVHEDASNPVVNTAVDTEPPASSEQETIPTTIIPDTPVEVPNLSSFEEAATSADIIEILGDDPSASQDYGPDINKEVASRFAHFTTSGLDKEVRKELLKKHLVPGNCTNVAAPQLNTEIKAALPEYEVKRDKAMEARQRQIAAGITFLAKIISDQLSKPDKDGDLIKSLMEIGRLFCDVQHSESEARRHLVLNNVKKDLKDQLTLTKIDKFLFGDNFAETLKTAKVVSKSSSDLKPEAARKPKYLNQNKGSSSKKNLNWKARTSARRQTMAPQQRYQPPAQQNAMQQSTSSQSYTQRSKQTRRQ